MGSGQRELWRPHSLSQQQSVTDRCSGPVPPTYPPAYRPAPPRLTPPSPFLVCRSTAEHRHQLDANSLSRLPMLIREYLLLC